MTETVRVSTYTGPLQVCVSAAEAISVEVISLPVSVRVLGQPGPDGPAGPAGTAESWSYFATSMSAAPALLGDAAVSGAGGSVWAYVLDGVTRFRFVPDAYSFALDGFYSAFSGGVLSGLIVSRG